MKAPSKHGLDVLVLLLAGWTMLAVDRGGVRLEGTGARDVDRRTFAGLLRRGLIAEGPAYTWTITDEGRQAVEAWAAATKRRIFS